jgi:hypothetical protein
VSRRADRELAISSAHATCPRCAAPRQASQSYCLECGLRLPVVEGGLAVLRRSWLRSLGWYPGDWVWLALAAGLVAAGGAAASIAVGRHHAAAAATTFVAPAPHRLAPPATTEPNGRTTWPEGLDGWTVVLLSAPAPKGEKQPLAIASNAARSGLPQVGVLDSSDFSSLHPGYDVVFSGVYSVAGDASTALESVRARGFGGAYVVRVTP